jgi:hypothetical protein
MNIPEGQDSWEAKIKTLEMELDMYRNKYMSLLEDLNHTKTALLDAMVEICKKRGGLNE